MIKLNEKAFIKALGLIQASKVDNSAHWVPPSVERENDEIELHGFSEYAKWFLGIRENENLDTKGAYAFPFSSDFENINIKGLRAIVVRAAQYGYTDVEIAGEKLKKMYEGK